MADVTANFVSDRHALYVGWVLGLGLKNGQGFRPVVDSKGNYTDRISIDLGPAIVQVVVPAPPATWTMA